MAGGPPKKVLKKEPGSKDPVFEDFFKSFTDLDAFKGNVKELCSAKGNCLAVLKIKNCNAGVGIRFSNAFCETVMEDDQIYQFGTIFKTGFSILSDFLLKRKVPDDERFQKLLATLLQFLMNTKLQEQVVTLHYKAKGALKTETSQTVALAEHLFAPLSTDKAYKLDKRMTRKESKCMCGCETLIDHSKYADTSLGVIGGWHGYLDILMTHLNIEVESTPDSPGGRAFSEVEVQYNPDQSVFHDEPMNKYQLLAQTIVFAFYQRKKYPELEHFLVPGIRATIYRVAFYMYDSKEDYLLRTRTMPLLKVKKKKLDYSTVVALWLVLNYKDLGTGLSKQIKNTAPQAGLHKFLGEHLNNYKNEVELGEPYADDIEDDFEPAYNVTSKYEWPHDEGPEPDF